MQVDRYAPKIKKQFCSIHGNNASFQYFLSSGLFECIQCKYQRIMVEAKREEAINRNAHLRYKRFR